jgi:nucleoside-diphosphate-sugar epimerase
MTHAKPVVIVSGSSGYVGSAIIDKLAKDFTRVGLDGGWSLHPPVAAECVCIDITSDQKCRRLQPEIRFGFHCLSLRSAISAFISPISRT